MLASHLSADDGTGISGTLAFRKNVIEFKKEDIIKKGTKFYISTTFSATFFK